MHKVTAVRKLHVRKGDMVAVLTGKDAGKRGKVLEVFPREARAIVEGVNIIKRHVRPDRQNPQGGVVERPGKIHVSNLMVVCPSCDQPSRQRHRRAADGTRVRVCARCGKSMD
ncbi:MAG: 50S ribosomal protein L24 [Limnochordales bacterium]|nr:50S ribosomal protein L24 [Limnochordales bacterium]